MAEEEPPLPGAAAETMPTAVVPLDMEDKAPVRTKLKTIAIIGALYVCHTCSLTVIAAG